jgi:hypothetical protein
MLKYLEINSVFPHKLQYYSIDVAYVVLYQVLEKMRPIDQKLKYQVDKVIAIAATGGQGIYTIYISLLPFII